VRWTPDPILPESYPSMPPDPIGEKKSNRIATDPNGFGVQESADRSEYRKKHKDRSHVHRCGDRLPLGEDRHRLLDRGARDRVARARPAWRSRLARPFTGRPICPSAGRSPLFAIWAHVVERLDHGCLERLSGVARPQTVSVVRRPDCSPALVLFVSSVRWFSLQFRQILININSFQEKHR
jgi:hypothetical protein